MLTVETRNNGVALIAQVIRTVKGHFLYCVSDSSITPIIESLGYGFVDIEEADMVRQLIGINSRSITVFAIMKHSSSSVI